MPQLYVAVYLAPTQRLCPDEPIRVATAFYAAAQHCDFPYDIGDDPSFYAARHLDGPVTWGVCRPDVRSWIQPGDWVVFFAAERKSEVTTYRFVGGLKVKDKVAQTALFHTPRYRLFRKYLNLIVRPHGSGWEHYEPALHKYKWHKKDWLWRICEWGCLTKVDVNKASKRHGPGKQFPHRIPIGRNYIVFSMTDAVLAVDPPLVAQHRQGEAQETWCSDRVSRSLRRLLLKGSKRGLRTSNRHQPHRHFRRDLDDPGFAEKLSTAARLPAFRTRGLT